MRRKKTNKMFSGTQTHTHNGIFWDLGNLTNKKWYILRTIIYIYIHWETLAYIEKRGFNGEYSAKLGFWPVWLSYVMQLGKQLSNTKYSLGISQFARGISHCQGYIPLNKQSATGVCHWDIPWYTPSSGMIFFMTPDGWLLGWLVLGLSTWDGTRRSNSRLDEKSVGYTQGKERWTLSFLAKDGKKRGKNITSSWILLGNKIMVKSWSSHTP